MESPNLTAQSCVLYARVSTEDQAEKYGLASQIRALQSYAEQRGYSVVDICSDDGYSGGTLDRPALSKVRELVRQKLVHVMVAYEPDRLARSLVHQLILHEELEKAGVRHEYVTFTVSDDHEGKLLLNIKGVIAEYEKEKIKERTMRVAVVHMAIPLKTEGIYIAKKKQNWFAISSAGLLRRVSLYGRLSNGSMSADADLTRRSAGASLR
jgi:predicted site-specific integrase-resolvase